MPDPAAGAIRVAALYRFTPIDDPRAVRAMLIDACTAAGIGGTLLIAPEGINGTIAGADDGVETVLTAVRRLPGCTDLAIAESRAGTTPFHRMKVRLKREIVTMGVPAIDAARDAGCPVDPAGWNAVIAAPGTIVVDTRNCYEVAVGSFAGAVSPNTQHFREFPDWVRANRDALLAAPTVAMFCTGGIRCEKATALLKAEGVADVRHLRGGILAYLDTVEPAGSQWQGECFVFDERVAVGHGLAPGSHTLCRACRMPVSAADRDSALYREGVSCPHCYARRDDAQRAGYAERQRQAALAAARGQAHVGAVFDRSTLTPRSC